MSRERLRWLLTSGILFRPILLAKCLGLLAHRPVLRIRV